MQQLSLFDFGEEAPKPEKKSKASKDSIEHLKDQGNSPDPEAEEINDATETDTASFDQQSVSPFPESSAAGSAPGASETENMGSTVSKEDNDPGNTTDETEAFPSTDMEHVQPESSLSSDLELPTTEMHSSSQTDNLTEPTIDDEQLNQPDASEHFQITAEPAAPAGPPGEDDQGSKDILFSNEQIRVKKYVVKSVRTVSYNKPPKPSQENVGVLSNTETKEPELDTSFSTDDFTPQTPAQDQQQVDKNNSEVPESELQKNDNDKVLLRDDDIHAESNSDLAIDGEITLNPEINNQQNEDKKTVKKPFYVEDQTVPVRKRGRKSFKEIDAEVDLINVPPDEELFQKQYYPISVVAKWFRVNNSLLRFWENEFKILKPKKNKKGDRFFRPEDVKNLQLIYYLLRQKKLTINGAIKHLKSYKEQTEVNMQLIQTLNDFKGFLLELKSATEK